MRLVRVEPVGIAGHAGGRRRRFVVSYHINAGSYVAVLDADTVNINDARVFLSERSLPAN